MLSDLPKGGSIAVNGCCLTAIEVDSTGFSCDLTEETLRRTAFETRLVPGRSREPRAAHAGQWTVSTATSSKGTWTASDTSVRCSRSGTRPSSTSSLPPELERYLVEKGSVTVDGISLTVASLESGVFSVALIPYTLQVTNLGTARAGDAVNIEVDVIAKYVERLLSFR